MSAFLNRRCGAPDLIGVGAAVSPGDAVQRLTVRRGGADEAAALLALFDDAVAWLVARADRAMGRQAVLRRPREAVASSELRRARRALVRERRIRRVRRRHRPRRCSRLRPGRDLPELYVQVMITAAAWRGQGVGARLIDHAIEIARERGADQLRVDCWAGVPELPAAYERLGFVRTGSFEVRGWRGAILVRRL